MLIEIIDKGKERYEIQAEHNILGRQYDNVAESMTVQFPQYEINKGSKCFLIATNSGDVVDFFEIQNNTPILIQNTLTKYSCVNIGFSFQLDDYTKNSEIQQFKNLPAQKPDDFVPVTPEQERKFNKLYEKAFTYVAWKEGTNNVMVFKNLDGEIVKEISLSPFMQEQSDLAEQDSTKETFVKNKELKYLAEDSTHRTVTDTEKQTWNNKSDFSGDYNDLTNKPTIPSALSDLTDDSTHRVVTDIEKLRWNNQVANLDLSLDTTTYVLSIQLKDYQGNNLGNAKTVDLPIEGIVASATYYETYTYDGVTYNKVIVLTYTTTDVPTIVPVGDLISGLQTEITPQNKLSADLVDDTNATNKFVTAQEKSQISTNTSNIADLQENKVDKTQLATQQTAGLVYMWEDANGKHIWNIDPNQVHSQETPNEQGGETYEIKTMAYTTTPNLQGGMTYNIGTESTQEEPNEQGGVEYNIRNENYVSEPNLSGGITYEIN